MKLTDKAIATNKKIVRGKEATTLAYLVAHKRVQVDQDVLVWYGNFTAYIDDQGRVKLALKDGTKYAFLHKLIEPAAEYVDHKDGYPGNNLRSNLRPCTLSQNQGNRKIGKNNTSGYKGIAWHKASQKYRARISTKDGEQYLGVFKSLRLAVIAYNTAAIAYWGEFAKLNEVPDETD